MDRRHARQRNFRFGGVNVRVRGVQGDQDRQRVARQSADSTYMFRYGTGFVIFSFLLGLYAFNYAPVHEYLIEFGKYLPDSVNEQLRAIHKKPETKVSKHDWMKGPNGDSSLKVFSLEDIKFQEGGPLYLVLIGHVFNVSSGAEYYGPGSGYHAFIGRDASRSFVTGEFQDHQVTDDLKGLSPEDYMGLSKWLEFYLDHDKYKFVGYLNGKYFNGRRQETPAMAELKRLMKWASEEKDKENDLLHMFPSCNVDWKAETGSTLWCSNRSGGVERDWAGYPRKFFETPTKQPRCACVHPNHLADPRVKEYLGCPSDADSCKLLETDTDK